MFDFMSGDKSSKRYKEIAHLYTDQDQAQYDMLLSLLCDPDIGITVAPEKEFDYKAQLSEWFKDDETFADLFAEKLIGVPVSDWTYSQRYAAEKHYRDIYGISEKNQKNKFPIIPVAVGMTAMFASILALLATRK